MRKLMALTLAIAAALLSLPALPAPAVLDVPRDEPPAELPANLTRSDVLSMMTKLPATEFGKAPYRWDRVGQASRIADAIAKVAMSWADAADLTVFAAYEGGNRLGSVGDGGRSFGPWQLSTSRTPVNVATDPVKAAAVWLSLAAQSRKDCAKLDEDERLAELASGSCERGRQLARRRAALSRRVLATD